MFTHLLLATLHTTANLGRLGKAIRLARLGKAICPTDWPRQSDSLSAKHNLTVIRYPVPGTRDSISGIWCVVPSARCLVPGAWCVVSRPVTWHHIWYILSCTWYKVPVTWYHVPYLVPGATYQVPRYLVPGTNVKEQSGLKNGKQKDGEHLGKSKII